MIICAEMGLIKLEGILLQAVPRGWLPFASAGSGTPLGLHWKKVVLETLGLTIAPAGTG